MYCGCAESKVIDSRPTDDSIRRRRECINCGKRFTTYEKIETGQIYIIKKDGRRELFNRDKLKSGLVKACEKRAISMDRIDAVVDDIEKQLSSSVEQEVKSEQIGEVIMNKLKELDEVAYVRFASVYRHFEDINTFYTELNKLMQEGKETKSLRSSYRGV